MTVRVQIGERLYATFTILIGAVGCHTFEADDETEASRLASDWEDHAYASLYRCPSPAAGDWLDRDMAPAPTLRTADEIHRHLLEQINIALRRPEMYGGEHALWSLFGYLGYIESAEPSIWTSANLDEWRKRGVLAPTSRGVAQALGKHLPEPVDGAVATVFAEEAWHRGWLTPDRTLPTGEYQVIRATYRKWVSEDRTRDDVLGAFGKPSILIGSNNPRFGSWFGYCTDHPAYPIIWFHLWNRVEPGGPPGAAPLFEQPVLVAARSGNEPLPLSITYSPEGERRRPLGE